MRKTLICLVLVIILLFGGLNVGEEELDRIVIEEADVMITTYEIEYENEHSDYIKIELPSLKNLEGENEGTKWEDWDYTYFEEHLEKPYNLIGVDYEVVIGGRILTIIVREYDKIAYSDNGIEDKSTVKVGRMGGGMFIHYIDLKTGDKLDILNVEHLYLRTRDDRDIELDYDYVKENYEEGEEIAEEVGLPGFGRAVLGEDVLKILWDSGRGHPYEKDPDDCWYTYVESESAREIGWDDYKENQEGIKMETWVEIPYEWNNDEWKNINNE